MGYEIAEERSPELLEPFRSLKGKASQVGQGMFIAESPKIVARVLASNVAVEVLYATTAFFEEMKPLLIAREGIVRVVIAEKQEMEMVVGYNLHQGVMLSARVPERGLLVEHLRPIGERAKIVVLDSIADPENMGGIIRTCAAFGAHALVVDERSCHPFLRRSVRVSMGNIVNVPIFRVPDLRDALPELKNELGVTIVGAALEPTSTPLKRIAIQGPKVLLFGSEGEGIDPELLALSDILAEIPMAGDVSSLNVGVACGIFLHHFFA